jgi:hypothetical protein
MLHRVVMAVVVALAPGGCSPQVPPAGENPAIASQADAGDAYPPPALAVILPAAPGPDAPPTVNGVFVDKGACPGEGCYLQGRIKAREAVSLYQDKRTDSPVLATIAPDEWVEILGTEDRLIPLAGTDRATGDVVYRLGYEGEGCFTLWNKGQLSGWCDDDGDLSNDSVIWSAPADSADTSLGFWVEVKRANGQTGWLGDDSDGSLACTGYQDRDPDCPPLL